nr:hypothetical protein [uncultured Cupriavidus sp.]
MSSITAAFSLPLEMFAGAAAPIAAAFLGVVIATIKGWIESKATRERIERVEEKAIANPEKPQLAWDLARTKLESYLDRNLAQVRSIFWLTLIVMLAGFLFILYGLNLAIGRPESLPVAVVGAASGVIISFIGGSFLLIYRSILSQSKEYVTVLERINAVGMAVQVIANIPDDNAQLKHETTALLAKQLLGLYGVGEATESLKKTARPRKSRVIP